MNQIILVTGASFTVLDRLRAEMLRRVGLEGLLHPRRER